MIEQTLVWAGVVIILAALLKHELYIRREAIKDRYDNELQALAKGLTDIRNLAESTETSTAMYGERLLRLERQINDAQVAKSLGRR